MKSSRITALTNNIFTRRSLASLALSAGMLMVGCDQITDAPSATESNLSVDSAAEQIQISVGIENNYATEACPNEAGSCYVANITLTFPERMPKNWRIMFSNLSPINQAISNELSLTHVNGDMHEIKPKISKLDANTPYEIKFYGNTPLVSESVFFPNYLLVTGNGENSVIASTTERLTKGHQLPRPQHIKPFTTPEQMLRSANDKVAIADVYERYTRFSSRIPHYSPAAKLRIIPKLHSANWSKNRIELTQGVRLPELADSLDGVNAALINAITKRFSQNSLLIDAQGLAIEVSLQSNLPAEGYTLLINSQDIQITYADSAGLYYAMMSIAQLYDAKSNSLPQGLVQDQPSMSFRGLHIDVSRNFRSKEFILQTLDQMSYYKLNKLHLHLADDEGWRLQIASLPELTDVGAFRCFDESEKNCLLPQLAGGDGKLAATQQNSGFYSVDDYIEILHYAHARQIEVLPSLDMPGHSRAAIVSMNARYQRLMLEENPTAAEKYFLTESEDTSEYRSIQHYNDNTLNPCLDSTYTFVTEVLKQLKEMHIAAGVPLKRYHIGGDETAGAWTNSPACETLIAANDELTEAKQLGSYFIEKVAHQVSDLGIIPASWSDGLSHANLANLPAKVQANAWETLYSGGHNKVHQMINDNWDVVLSTPDVLYFDFPYEADPIEPGYYWGSRNTDSYQVFQFMPNNLPVHAEIWTDNFGNNYAATATINIQNEQQVLGIQAQLWGETVRSDAQANYMLFPRLLAVAERAWHTPTWAEDYKTGVSYSAETEHFDKTQTKAMHIDWLNFSHLLSTKAMPQLIADGIVPRVPLPGAMVEGGKLFMHTTFSGLQLEFQINGQDWQVFTTPVKLPEEAITRVRATVPNASVSSRDQPVIMRGQ
ncbi:family 20 glycosylhydrolase [uncultured Paraglaciecola sp.]|uniref:family 20 glycosylhydrolase n=1 Tax=uncultured Paraglaciecola sp. TaxID=1765024 RepID=UPI0025EEF281|nr:family 20 glycosylhydrolase [uncultured Paraglaciecola sp.]